MHSHDDKHPARPGFEPGIPRLQTPVDTNEPSGPATLLTTILPSSPYLYIFLVTLLDR